MATVYRDVDFGLGNGGLTDVHYRVIAPDGSVILARTNSGVLEHPDGEGGYGAAFALPDHAVGTVIWDGDGQALFARERIDLTSEPNAIEIADTVIKRRMADAKISPFGGTLTINSIYGMVQMQQFSGPPVDVELPVYHPDGVSLLGTITLYASPGATPVIGTRAS